MRSLKLAFHDADTDIDTDTCTDILQEIARVGRVGEDPREDVRVGDVECQCEGLLPLRISKILTSLKLSKW